MFLGNFAFSQHFTRAKIASQPAGLALYLEHKKKLTLVAKLQWLAVFNLSGLNDYLAVVPSTNNTKL